MLYISREVATFTPPKTNILPEAAGFVNTLFIHARCLHSTYTVYTSQVSTFCIYSLYMPGVYILHIQSIHARCLKSTYTVYILYSYMPGVYNSTVQYVYNVNLPEVIEEPPLLITVLRSRQKPDVPYVDFLKPLIKPLRANDETMLGRVSVPDGFQSLQPYSRIRSTNFFYIQILLRKII